jgi:hypothetical protein
VWSRREERRVESEGSRAKLYSILLSIKVDAAVTYPLSSSPVRIPGFHPGDPGSNPGNGMVLIFFPGKLHFSSLIFLAAVFVERAGESWVTDRKSKANLVTYMHL